MVTRGRPERAIRAIEMFQQQTWAHKDLLVVVDVRSPGAEQLAKHLAGASDVRLVVPPALDNYAQLRNLAIAEARGDVICMWDDDDLYHPRRLEVQYTKMVADGAQACFFDTFIHYDETTSKLRWVNFPWGGGHPGTLMCERSAAPHYPDGPGPERGRDSLMQADLVARVKATKLLDGYLYVYVYHGGNMWDRAHHSHLAARIVSPRHIVDNFAVTQQHLAELDLHINRPSDLWC